MEPDVGVPEGEIMQKAEVIPQPAQRPEKRTPDEIDKDPRAFSLESNIPRLLEEEAQGKTIVVTNGHFAPAHLGHFKSFLRAREKAASLFGKSNDEVILLVVVNNDEQSTAKHPLNAAYPARERAEAIYYNSYTDFVVVSEAPQGDSSLVSDFEKLGQAGVIGANFLYVKGGDYGQEANVPPEAEVVKQFGGRFEIIERSDDLSSTAIRDRVTTIVSRLGPQPKAT